MENACLPDKTAFFLVYQPNRDHSKAKSYTEAHSGLIKVWSAVNPLNFEGQCVSPRRSKKRGLFERPPGITDKKGRISASVASWINGLIFYSRFPPRPKTPALTVKTRSWRNRKIQNLVGSLRKYADRARHPFRYKVPPTAHPQTQKRERAIIDLLFILLLIKFVPPTHRTHTKVYLVFQRRKKSGP